MIVLGVDPGSKITGYGIVAVKQIEKKAEQGNLVAIDYGVIKVDDEEIFHQKLKKIYEAITEIIKKHRPTELAIETAFYGENFQSAFKIGHVRGVVMLAGVNAGVPIFEYTPREIKKSVTGRGSATKEQVQFMVRTILGLKNFQGFYDVSDALAIAICHINRTLLPESARYRDWKAFLKAHPEIVESSEIQTSQKTKRRKK